MPGFYRQIPEGIEWKTFMAVPIQSLEMTFEDADCVLCIVPHLTEQITREGVKDVTLTFSVCTPVSGNNFIQLCASGIAKVEKELENLIVEK